MHKKNIYFSLLFIVGIIFIPFLFSARTVLLSDIPFWYDPARDFILAFENLKKLSLIGPTSGIPGLFYGPYWIWFLSVGLLFSKDPSIVVLLILTIPYFTVVPYILITKFSSVFGKSTVILLWLLFALTVGNTYAVQPWNPHVAPLFTVMLFYLLLQLFEIKILKKQVITALVAGICCGIVLNVHISFGIGLSLGTILFLIVMMLRGGFRKTTKRLIGRSGIIIASYLFGIFFMFIPFFVFEIRHQFQQIQVILNTITQSVLHNAAVVGQIGLTKQAIATTFLTRVTDIVGLPKIIGMVFSLGICGYLFYLVVYKRKVISPQSLRLLLLSCCVGGALFLVYLTSKNPVWGYHFIGVEIVFFMLVGLCMKYLRLLQLLIVVIVVVLFFNYVRNVLTPANKTTPTLATKKEAVQQICTDAKTKDFGFYAYNPAIYTYDYAYLFSILCREDITYKPEDMRQNLPIVYILIPVDTEQRAAENFINFRTPNSVYTTINTWKVRDGSVIIKREMDKQN